MINSITSPIAKVSYSNRAVQNNHSNPQCSFGNKAIIDLESPNGFYNRSLINNKKISNINFGFYLTKVPGIPCPCCGRLMYTTKEIKKLATQLSTAKGHEIAEILGPHVQNLHPVEQQVATMLVGLSNKHSDKNIKKLLVLEHQTSNPILELEQTQIRIINAVIKDAKQLESTIGRAAIELLEQMKRIILEPEKGEFFRRKTAIEAIDRLRNQQQHPANSTIWEGMSEKILKLPSSTDSSLAFVVKYSHPQRSALEIAQRLFSPNLSTIEHIKPAWRKTEGVERGANDISNYLAMCSGCNCHRDTKPYYLFVETNPDMYINLPRHMNRVQQLIIRDWPLYSQAYLDYPWVVRKAINRESTPPGGSIPRLDFSTALMEGFLYERKKHHPHQDRLYQSK